MHLPHKFDFPLKIQKSAPLRYIKKRDFKYKRNIVKVESSFKWLDLDIKGFIPKYFTASLHAWWCLRASVHASDTTWEGLFTLKVALVHEELGPPRSKQQGQGYFQPLQLEEGENSKKVFM